MTHKENITAILECHFQGFKEEIIESACNRILEQEPCEDCISRKAVMKVLCDNCELCEDGVQTCFSKCEEYHFLATLPSIQPKTKTDVLDKIRAEIKEESRFCPLTEGLERALEIIDKYKAESEDKE